MNAKKKLRCQSALERLEKQLNDWKAQKEKQEQKDFWPDEVITMAGNTYFPKLFIQNKIAKTIITITNTKRNLGMFE